MFKNFMFSAVQAPGVFVPPTASNVQIAGILYINGQLIITYDYSGSLPESGSTFQGYRADDAIGTGAAPIGGATGLTYTEVDADIGKWIRWKITPSDGTTTGAPAYSPWVGPVEDLGLYSADHLYLANKPSLLFSDEAGTIPAVLGGPLRCAKDYQGSGVNLTSAVVSPATTFYDQDTGNLTPALIPLADRTGLEYADVAPVSLSKLFIAITASLRGGAQINSTYLVLLTLYGTFSISVNDSHVRITLNGTDYDFTLAVIQMQLLDMEVQFNGAAATNARLRVWNNDVELAGAPTISDVLVIGSSGNITLAGPAGHNLYLYTLALFTRTPADDERSIIASQAGAVASVGVSNSTLLQPLDTGFGGNAAFVADSLDGGPFTCAPWLLKSGSVLTLDMATASLITSIRIFFLIGSWFPAGRPATFYVIINGNTYSIACAPSGGTYVRTTTFGIEIWYIDLPVADEIAGVITFGYTGPTDDYIAIGELEISNVITG